MVLKGICPSQFFCPPHFTIAHRSQAYISLWQPSIRCPPSASCAPTDRKAYAFRISTTPLGSSNVWPASPNCTSVRSYIPSMPVCRSAIASRKPPPQWRSPRQHPAPSTCCCHRQRKSPAPIRCSVPVTTPTHRRIYPIPITAIVITCAITVGPSGWSVATATPGTSCTVNAYPRTNRVAAARLQHRTVSNSRHVRRAGDSSIRIRRPASFSTSARMVTAVCSSAMRSSTGTAESSDA